MIQKLIPQKIKNIKHFFVAHFFNLVYKRPSKKLKVIGITGTDGKTTTANIIYTILKLSGKKVGLISTINAKVGEKAYPLAFHVTNPGPKDLQNFLKMMTEEKLEYVVLETTSHGLDQYRVAGISYDFAVYTNVTHDHFDYHKNYDNYLKTKGKLINYTKSEGTVILNRDDESFEYLSRLANMLDRKAITYGFSKNSDIKADDLVKENKKNMDFQIEIDKKNHKFSTNLLGRYNIGNIMATIAIAKEIGIPKTKIKKALKEIPTLEGRWEVITSKPFMVVVDFAHTPNSLENVLKRGESIKNNKNKLIVVFGCPGKRDTTKREKMGKIAGDYADNIILTADDPRGEDIGKINEEIKKGIQLSKNIRDTEYISITNREKAIKKAFEMARKDDVVILAGKGHEKSLNLDGKNEIPWSDKKTALKLLNKYKNNK